MAQDSTQFTATCSSEQELIELGMTTFARSGDQTRNGDGIPTIDELSRCLSVANPTRYKLAQEGKPPGEQVGKQWLFRINTIDSRLEELGPGQPPLSRISTRPAA